MDDLLSEFVAETRETLEAIAGEIVAWEANPGDRARLDSIFRFVHTVKGSCGFLDLHRLEKLSHAAEDALAQVRGDLRQADAALVNAVLRIVDRIGEVVEAIDTGGTVADGDDDQLIAALAERDEIDPEPAVLAVGRSSPRAPSRTIRLPVDLLDRMMSGVSDMVLARNELLRRMREVPPDNGLETAFERLSTCVAEMRDAIARTRMQRVENLFTALPRMVRDLSAELAKQVALDVDGGDVELDREMIEMIRDPLVHIVRNAIDHGIEKPDVRVAAGKPRGGLLKVRARQSGNQILIDVVDDGRGIDGERLVERAVAAGLIDASRARAMRDDERLQLIFEPGLSTARAVTAISGRGVGMDVVRANVERIGGVVEIESRPGNGTRLTMRVPLTLTIIPALTVGCGGHHFAVPRSAIEEIVRVGSGSVRIETMGGAAIAHIRGRRVPVVTLAEVMGLTPSGGETQLVVVKPAGGSQFALAVDTVHDHEELVVKPAAPALMATGLYAGTTLPDDGRPMLLLDTGGVAEAAGVEALTDMAPAEASAAPPAATLPVLMFRDLDGSRRAVRLSLVERIEDVPARSVAHVAGRLRFVRDGRALPLLSWVPIPPGQATIRVLRLGDGREEVGYAIAEVLDIASIEPTLIPAARPGSIAGAALVAGGLVEVLDPHALFASVEPSLAAGPVGAPERPLCLLQGDAGDSWTREILAPLIEQAGYRLAWHGDAPVGEATLVIDAGGVHAAGLPPVSGRVVRLRDRPDGAGEGSIYRYDRDALIAAIGARGGARA